MRNKLKEIGTTRVVLLSLIWITGFADLITFYMGNHAFEANPLFLLSGSYTLLLGVKFGVLVGVSYLLVTYRPKKSYIWAFMLCFLALYCVFAQGVGIYSNLHVQNELATQPEGTVVPMEKQQAALSYALLFGVIILYLPMFLSLVTFFIFEKIYLKDII